MTERPTDEGETRQPRREKTRKRLLEAAAAVFGRRGYEGSTFREIAETAGLSRGLLSFHFGSKREMELAVAEWVHERWVRRLAAVYPHRDDGSIVDRLLDAHAELTLGERESARLLCRLRLDPAPDTAPLRQRMQRIDEAVSQATRVVLADLTGRPPESLGEAAEGRGQWVISALHGIELRAAAGEDADLLLKAYQTLRRDLLALLQLERGDA